MTARQLAIPRRMTETAPCVFCKSLPKMCDIMPCCDPCEVYGSTHIRVRNRPVQCPAQYRHHDGRMLRCIHPLGHFHDHVDMPFNEFGRLPREAFAWAARW